MLAVVVKNSYALLTLLSIRAVLPELDPYIVYVGKPDPAVVDYLAQHQHDPARTTRLLSFDLPSLHAVLATLTDGYVLSLHGGMLLLKDPSAHLPDAARMSFYSTAVARKYMYGRRVGYHAYYRTLGLNTRVHDYRLELSYHRLSVPYKPKEFMLLSPMFRQGFDPLLQGFMHGREILKHSKDAEAAIVMDFLDQAIDPNLSIMEAYGCPLEYYSRLAEQVADHLPAKDLPVLRRNGRRSEMMAPVRVIIKSPHDP